MLWRPFLSIARWYRGGGGPVPVSTAEPNSLVRVVFLLRTNRDQMDRPSPRETARCRVMNVDATIFGEPPACHAIMRKRAVAREIQPIARQHRQIATCGGEGDRTIETILAGLNRSSPRFVPVQMFPSRSSNIAATTPDDSPSAAWKRVEFTGRKSQRFTVRRECRRRV